MSGSAGQITVIQSLFVPHSGRTKPHSFPKAPLCHELSLNATRLSIDLLAMHFLSCFDVIVVSVYGRFQIKLWRVLAFKPVISEGGGLFGCSWINTFYFFHSFFFIFGHKLDYVTLFSTGRIKCPSLQMSSMKPSPPARHCRGAQCLLGLGRWLCQEYEWDKIHSPTVQRDHYTLQLHTSCHFHLDSLFFLY